MTTIQNPTGPSLYNNNDVFSFFDFRTVAGSITDLSGTTVVIGDVTYTLGSNWLPKFSDPLTNIAPAELANSLVEAINGTYENAPNVDVLTDKIGRANSSASAYATGGVVHLVKRTPVAPFIDSTFPGVTPSPPSAGSFPQPDLFFTAAINSSNNPVVAPNATTALANNFSIENPSDTYKIYVSRVDDLSEIIIFPLMGNTFSGSPDYYQMRTDVGGVFNPQVIFRFNRGLS